MTKAQQPSAEEIEHWRAVIRDSDQRKRGVDLSYERRDLDGTYSLVNVQGASPEQAALVAWLKAEDAWKAAAAREERKRQQELEKQRKKQEQKEEVRRQLAEHEELVGRAYGFRKAVLERHEPYESHIFYQEGHLLCSHCTDGEYEPEQLPFPCSEYEFARYWQGPYGEES